MANPADMLSREGKAPFKPTTGKVEPMVIPDWADQSVYSDIGKVLDTLHVQVSPSLGPSLGGVQEIV